MWFKSHSSFWLTFVYLPLYLRHLFGCSWPWQTWQFETGPLNRQDMVGFLPALKIWSLKLPFPIPALPPPHPLCACPVAFLLPRLAFSAGSYCACACISFPTFSAFAFAQIFPLPFSLQVAFLTLWCVHCKLPPALTTLPHPCLLFSFIPSGFQFRIIPSDSHL